MIDLNAPIIPWEGMGNIKLYSTLRDLRAIIENEKAIPVLHGNFLVRYEIEGKLDLFFNLINGKLFKITTLQGYKGKLFDKIYAGMNMDELLKIDNSFEFDDFEEVYVSSKGVFVEPDPENRAVCISIFIRELETDKFDKADW